jgi:hypothetical protein
MMDYSYHFFIILDRKVYRNNEYMHVLGTTLRVEEHEHVKVTHDRIKNFSDKVLFIIV